MQNNEQTETVVESQTMSEMTENSATEETQVETTEESETLEATAEATEGEESKEEAKDSETKGKEEFSGVKKRIDKLTKKLSLKDQEIEHWKAQALKGQNQEGKTQEATKQEVKSQDGEPQEEQFDTYKDYLKAQVKWELAQEKKQIQEQERQAKSVQEFNSKIQDFSKEHPDFFDVLEECDEQVSTQFHVQEAIRNSDMPAAVMYELAKNPAEIERLNGLSVIAAAKEIGKIEARLSVQSESKVQTTKQTQTKITKAPKPISPVGKSGTVQTWSIDDPNIPFAEFEKLRMKELKSKGY